MRSIAEPVNARSLRTRAALLAATRDIIEEEGFRALSMERVAERAGVTRRSVYLHFESRSHLVGSLFDYVADVEKLEDSLSEVWRASGGRATLRAWAAHVARYHPRLLAVDRAVLAEAQADPDAAAHRRRVTRAKLANCRRVTDRLEEDDALAAGWDAQSAADALFALDSSDLISALLTERRWTRAEFASRYQRMLEDLLIRDRKDGAE